MESFVDIPFNETAAKNAKENLDIPCLADTDLLHVKMLKEDIARLRKLVEEMRCDGIYDDRAVFHVMKECAACPFYKDAPNSSIQSCYSGEPPDSTDLIISILDSIWNVECRKHLVIKKERLTKRFLDENGTLRPNYFFSSDVASLYIDWIRVLEGSEDEGKPDKK